MTHGRWRGDAELMLVVLIWALNLSIVKISLLEMSPLAFNGLRFAGAALVLLVLTRGMEGSLAIARADIPRFLVLAVVGNTLYQLLFIEGLERASASSTALIFGSTPVVVGLISWWTRQESLGARGIAGAVLTFTGVWFVAAGGGGGSDGSGPAGGTGTILGPLMVMGAVVCWSVYTVWSRPLLARYSPLRVTAVTLSVGALLLIPPCVPALVAQEWRGVSPGAWAGLFYSMLFALVLCYVLWYRSVREVGNLRTAVYSNLVPVFGAMFGILILGEPLTAGLLIGGGCILAGIVLVRWRRTETPGAPQGIAGARRPGA